MAAVDRRRMGARIRPQDYPHELRRNGNSNTYAEWEQGHQRSFRSIFLDLNGPSRDEIFNVLPVAEPFQRSASSCPIASIQRTDSIIDSGDAPHGTCDTFRKFFHFFVACDA